MDEEQAETVVEKEVKPEVTQKPDTNPLVECSKELADLLEKYNLDIAPRLVLDPAVEILRPIIEARVSVRIELGPRQKG